MTRVFGDIVKAILLHNGAIIEDYGDCIETLATPQIAGTLGIDELSHICFDHGTDSGTTLHLTYESELFERISGLFQNKGRVSYLTITPRAVHNEKVIASISEKVILNNAVFKYTKTTENIISYMLLFFRYSALSDEKKEGITQVLVNEMNLSTCVLSGNAMDNDVRPDILRELLSRKAKLQLESTDGKDILQVLGAAAKSLESATRMELNDFINSLNRRFNRNVARVTDYYNAMIAEAEQRAIKKGLSQEGIEDKLKGINTELKWKVQDLVSKFALTIRTELISAIRITVLSPVYWISINRRKGTREFPIPYNQLLRRVDNLSCECCFSQKKSYYVCDDKLHIICTECFGQCSKCGKQYCHICHPDGCQKCGKDIKSGK